MKLSRLTAELLFLFHCVVALIILFGWAYPEYWYLYIGILLGTLSSEVLLGYCFLSKWEFLLRKKLNPKLDYNYSFSSYYTHKFTQRRLTERFVKIAAIVFLSLSLIVNIYFHLS